MVDQKREQELEERRIQSEVDEFLGGVSLGFFASLVIAGIAAAIGGPESRSLLFFGQLLFVLLVGGGLSVMFRPVLTGWVLVALAVVTVGVALFRPGILVSFAAAWMRMVG